MTQASRPMAPARWTTEVSTEIKRSASARIAAVSAMGLDVMYSRLEGASLVNGVATSAVTPSGLGVSTPTLIDSNQDNFSVRFRVHRDFYP